jgi:hypothetical protein
MATSSERTSPPPFPDSEDQDLAECEGVGDRVSDEDGDGDDLFLSAVCLVARWQRRRASPTCLLTFDRLS